MKPMRNTTAKSTILQLLQDASVALAHAEILPKLAGICDRVTAYRVLDRLVAEGLAHKIVPTDGIVRYAACANCSHTQHIHNHIHFNCTKCKSVTCLEGVRPSYNLPNGYSIQDANFMLTGLCPSCH